jgi:hypothetical protein
MFGDLDVRGGRLISNPSALVRKVNMAVPTSVKGLVIPSAWDGEGKVISVIIAAFDETEYFIEEERWSKVLLGLIHHEVEVIGCVQPIGDRKYRIYPDNIASSSLTGLGADAA